MIRNSKSALLAFIGGMCAAAASHGHDLQGLVAERATLSPAARTKIEEVEQLRRILAKRAAETKDGQLEAVVQRSLRWQSNRVSVCFFDGSQASRDHVATIAGDWAKGTGLGLDFGPAGKRNTCDPARSADVRVSFMGRGYWSYVGTQARLIEPQKPTLNLSGMDKGTGFTPNDNGTILHEFGHAIGFEHEHQSPVARCEDEFDWSYLYSSMGWSKAEVDRNMRRLNEPVSKTGLLATPFDRSSIMLYALDPRAFVKREKASCYVSRANNAISDVDRSAAQVVYPVAQASPADAPPLPAGQAPKASTGNSADAAAAARAARRLAELVGEGR